MDLDSYPSCPCIFRQLIGQGNSQLGICNILSSLRVTSWYSTKFSECLFFQGELVTFPCVMVRQSLRFFMLIALSNTTTHILLLLFGNPDPLLLWGSGRDVRITSLHWCLLRSLNFFFGRYLYSHFHIRRDTTPCMSTLGT